MTTFYGLNQHTTGFKVGDKVKSPSGNVYTLNTDCVWMNKDQIYCRCTLPELFFDGWEYVEPDIPKKTVIIKENHDNKCKVLLMFLPPDKLKRNIIIECLQYNGIQVDDLCDISGGGYKTYGLWIDETYFESNFNSFNQHCGDFVDKIEDLDDNQN